jgi:hypothetical protein
MSYSSFTELWRLISPPWLLRTWGDKLITTFGDAQDIDHARAKESVKARFPLQCPADALASIGVDRGLPIANPAGTTETIAAWRTRLSTAWDLWADAGTSRGILRALYWAGLVDCTAFPPYDPQNPDYTFDPSQAVIVASAHDLGLTGRPDAPNTSWSVFWVIADSFANSITLDTHTWDASDANWDEWDGVGVWDLEESEATVNGWRTAIRTWKPAHATCPHMLIRGSSDWADIWGPYGAWGDADEDVWGSASDTVLCVIGEG